jgi:hypothetical protein
MIYRLIQLIFAAWLLSAAALLGFIAMALIWP